jgi:hypothetical protein
MPGCDVERGKRICMDCPEYAACPEKIVPMGGGKMRPKRADNKENRILALLRMKGGEGASQQELNAIAYRYGGFLHVLRRKGHEIESRSMPGKGCWRYYYSVDNPI